MLLPNVFPFIDSAAGFVMFHKSTAKTAGSEVNPTSKDRLVCVGREQTAAAVPEGAERGCPWEVS